MKSVLLLSCSNEPLNVISVKRAFKLWSLGKIVVLEEKEEEWNSATLKFQVPSVVALIFSVPYRRYIEPRISRRNFYYRDNFTCQYCGNRYPPKELTLDHVHPREKGGQTYWKNVVTACKPCNSTKDNLTLEQAGDILGMELISGKPRKPSSILLTLRLNYGGWNLPDEWKRYMFV